MLRLRNQLLFLCAVMLLAIASSCSKNPLSSNNEASTLRLSIKGIGNSGLLKQNSSLAQSNNVDRVTITSAKVVIEKVEFENNLIALFDFKFDRPFVQDLVTISSLQEIQTFQIPYGDYHKMKIAIDDLDTEDGDVFTDNPELQNLSIQIEGYVNDPAQSFGFTSDISFDVEKEFDPPIVIDETTVSKNIVLDFLYTGWFVDANGNFIDPSAAGNKSAIERNIKNSFEVFEDDDKDGERDEDFEVKARIESLGTDFLMLAGTKVFVNENTNVFGDNHQSFSFADLAVGMIIEVHAVFQTDGSLLATKIEVEDDDDDEDDGDEDFEAKARIESLGTDFLVLADTKVFVNENTNIFGDNHQSLSFADLAVDMIVEVHAVFQADRSLLATKIEVENDGSDSN